MATSCILQHDRLLLVKLWCYMSKWEHISSMTWMWLIWLNLWRRGEGILRRMLVFIRTFRSCYCCIRTFLIHSHKLLSHRFYLSIRTQGMKCLLIARLSCCTSDRRIQRRCLAWANRLTTLSPLQILLNTIFLRLCSGQAWKQLLVLRCGRNTLHRDILFKWFQTWLALWRL